MTDMEPVGDDNGDNDTTGNEPQEAPVTEDNNNTEPVVDNNDDNNDNTNENVTVPVTEDNNNNNNDDNNNNNDTNEENVNEPEEQVVATNTLGDFTEEEKKQIDSDGDGQVTTTELKTFMDKKKKDRTHALKAKFSQRTLNAMDKDGDGSISEDELANYIRSIRGNAGRYKIGVGISFALFLLSILGVFVLGFEITRQFGIESPKSDAFGTRRLTDREGKQLATGMTLQQVDMSDLFDDDFPEKSKMVSRHTANYNNTLVNVKIARTEIGNNIATLYDFTGFLRFEYYLNGFTYTYPDSGDTVEGFWIMYRTDFDGNVTVIPKEEDTTRRLIVPAPPRRLQSNVDDDDAVAWSTGE